VGNEWLSRGQTVLLRVPSAVVPHTWNWLFNPAHPGSRQAKIVEVVRATFDPRLFG
jgi:hypothetical protein